LREAMLSDEPPAWAGEGAGPYRSDLDIAVVRTGRTAVVRVRGEVDRDTAERFRIGLRGAIGTPGTDTVLVDLAGVPLIDAAGIAVLRDVACAAAVAAVGLTLTGAQAYVAQILAVAGGAGATAAAVTGSELRPDHLAVGDRQDAPRRGEVADES
jgi:RNA polymerase sigma-B factor